MSRAVQAVRGYMASTVTMGAYLFGALVILASFLLQQATGVYWAVFTFLALAGMKAVQYLGEDAYERNLNESIAEMRAIVERHQRGDA